MKKYIIYFVLSFVLAFLYTGCSSKKAIEVEETKHTSKARHKATMKKYKIRGQWYYPKAAYSGETMNGISSWYGPNFHGRHTSNGEIYNMNSFTAAHKTWPMDTMVSVKNLNNGLSVKVRINDRGPFVSGRIIDCSYAAGKALGLDKSGIAPVEIKVLGISKKISLGIGLQLASFSIKENAIQSKDDFSKKYSEHEIMLETVTMNKQKIVYNIIMYGFSSEDEANKFKETAQLTKAFIVK